MIDELKGICNEVVFTYLRFFPGISQDELRETQKSPVRVASVPAEIRTEHLPNTSVTAVLTSSAKYLKIILLCTRNYPKCSFH
jgi:hypothetical protein